MADPHPPVTLGYLRREAKWLHLYCNVCGHEREVDTTEAPWAALPDETVVPTLGKSMVCSKCGTKGHIWSVPETGRRRPRLRSGAKAELWLAAVAAVLPSGRCRLAWSFADHSFWQCRGAAYVGLGLTHA